MMLRLSVVLLLQEGFIKRLSPRLQIQYPMLWSVSVQNMGAIKQTIPSDKDNCADLLL